MFDHAGHNMTTVAPFPAIPIPTISAVFMLICSVIGVVANSLVLMIMGMSVKRRLSTYTYFISHLAFADLLGSIMHIVYVPVEVNKHDWPYEHFSCKFIYPLVTFFELLACGTILIITVERYKGVILPHCPAWKRYHVRLAFGIVWVICMLFVTPNVIAIKVTHYRNINYCNENWKDLGVGEDWQELYGVSFFLVSFFIPGACIFFMHTHILWKLRGRTLRPANESDHRVRNDVRIKRVLTGIICAFYLCVSPNKLLYLVWDVRPDLEKNLKSHARMYLRIMILFYYMRVAVDPLIYCFLDTRFKKDFYKNKIIRFVMSLSANGNPLNKGRSRTLSTQPSTTMSVDPSCLVLTNPYNGVSNGVIANGVSNGVITYGVSNGLVNGFESLSSSPVDVESSPQKALTIISESIALNTSIADEEEHVITNGAKPRTESTLTQNTSVAGSISPPEPLTCHMTKV